MKFINSHGNYKSSCWSGQVLEYVKKRLNHVTRSNMFHQIGTKLWMKPRMPDLWHLNLSWSGICQSFLKTEANEQTKGCSKWQTESHAVLLDCNNCSYANDQMLSKWTTTRGIVKIQIQQKSGQYLFCVLSLRANLGTLVKSWHRNLGSNKF